MSCDSWSAAGGRQASVNHSCPASCSALHAALVMRVVNVQNDAAAGTISAAAAPAAAVATGAQLQSQVVTHCKAPGDV
jgi:hypothetical protein